MTAPLYFTPVLTALHLALLIVEEHGYVSKKQANLTDEEPTAFRLQRVAEHFDAELTPAQTEAASLVYHHTFEGEARSDFDFTLREVLSSPRGLSSAQLVFAACAVGNFLRDQQRAAEDAERAANSTSRYVGTEGEMINVLVTCTRKHKGEGMFGPYVGYGFVDADGNEFSVFYTGNSFNCEPGDLLTLRGKVKGHEVFRGVKQTKLTRIKEVAASAAA